MPTAESQVKDCKAFPRTSLAKQIFYIDGCLLEKETHVSDSI